MSEPVPAAALSVSARHRPVGVPVLTARRLDVLQAISAFDRAHHYAPTLRQLLALTGTRSLSTINHHLAVLRREGYVTFDRDANGYMLTRSLLLTDSGRAAVAP